MKKKWTWLVDVVYWGIIIYSAFYDFFADITIADISSVINEATVEAITVEGLLQMVLVFVGILIMLLFFSFVQNILLTAVYIGVKIATNKYKKERLEKIDFKNDNYYRERLPEYSPAILSYIDDFKLDKEDIVATLLSLKLKKKIELNEGVKVIDSTYDDLTENEKYILEKVIAKDVANINMTEYQTIVSNECKQKGLLKEKSAEKSKMNKIFWTTILVCVFLNIGVFVFLGSYLPTVTNDIVIFVCCIVAFILMMSIFIVLGVTIVYISHYTMLKTINPYIRSKTGKEINEKLEGLKKYLKDYSTIESKNQQDIVMWEEYLIYSVIFGINEEIIDEVYSKIN